MIQAVRNALYLDIELTPYQEELMREKRQEYSWTRCLSIWSIVAASTVVFGLNEFAIQEMPKWAFNWSTFILISYIVLEVVTIPVLWFVRFAIGLTDATQRGLGQIQLEVNGEEVRDAQGAIREAGYKMRDGMLKIPLPINSAGRIWWVFDKCFDVALFVVLVSSGWWVLGLCHALCYFQHSSGDVIKSRLIEHIKNAVPEGADGPDPEAAAGVDLDDLMDNLIYGEEPEGEEPEGEEPDALENELITFRYEAMDNTGTEIRDTVDAVSEADAQTKIRQNGYFVTKIERAQ